MKKRYKMEIWKDVLGYEGYYQISNLGNIKSVDRYIKSRSGNLFLRKGKPMFPAQNGNGYLHVILNKNNKPKNHRIHRMVALVFLPAQEHRTDVNHIDGNKLNNRVDNLEWTTHKENCDHSMNVLGNDLSGHGVKATSKTIKLKDKETNEIIECKSYAEAARKLGISHQVISKYLNKDKKAINFSDKKYEIVLDYVNALN